MGNPAITLHDDILLLSFDGLHHDKGFMPTRRRHYGDLHRTHILLANRKSFSVQSIAQNNRDRIRMRGDHPWSQRVSAFSSPVLVKEFFPPVEKPLLVTLTEARQQTMRRQNVRVPPPSAAPPIKKGKGSPKASNGGMGRAKAERPFATTTPRFCPSCRKRDVLEL